MVEVHHPLRLHRRGCASQPHPKISTAGRCQRQDIELDGSLAYTRHISCCYLYYGEIFIAPLCLFCMIISRSITSIQRQASPHQSPALCSTLLASHPSSPFSLFAILSLFILITAWAAGVLTGTSDMVTEMFLGWTVSCTHCRRSEAKRCGSSARSHRSLREHLRGDKTR